MQREVREDVDWVSDEQQNRSRVERFHVVDHAGQDGLVAANEVGAGFACGRALASSDQCNKPLNSSSKLSVCLSVCGLVEPTFLLRRTSCHDDDVALPCFFVLCCSHARTRVAVVCRVAEILHLRIADLGLGIDEEDLGGDLAILWRGG